MKYFNTNSFRCIEETSCSGTNYFGQMILYEKRKMCLPEKRRYEYDCYLYEHDGKKKCITAEQCEVEERGYAYFELLICSHVLPVEDGNFAKRKDHVHSCGY